ncbi:RNA polymerase II transcription factor B subunit 4 [Microsporum canis]|uniref:General transcription and DNA repair factor IIH subunit TFB4 n=1 Tax=Arthroderma otae (strain ATCC MYA-4605 / CBS 113480) TaxID=554155 RepID=C5FJM3_ARTOC|nr:TFIIH basal transcription factor complex p34 subunit [Microsporum canis CBS 113480]EEQ30884.1 TFIIH basal transcription factor complex p34 subunit [Microsporum canis CBS 113480]
MAESTSASTDPSLLTVILDTNPHAWAQLQETLPLSSAVANLLVFINAHLACNYSNKVAVVASHSHQAVWLYPTPPAATAPPADSQKKQHPHPSNNDQDGDTPMTDYGEPAAPPQQHQQQRQPNKYRPFLLVEQQLTRNLDRLLTRTRAEEISPAASTMMAGALTLALSHINRETIAYLDTHGTAAGSDPAAGGAGGLPPPPGGAPPPGGTTSSNRDSSTDQSPAGGSLQSRILIVSVSSAADSAQQYIPIMNSIFACQRLHIPIDICKLAGDAVFLQQACDATRGIYMSVDSPRGFLQYLMLAFLPDQRVRRNLVLPTRVDVDFRAACFCHRKVVDVGFVCSICLSIFCEPPEGANCLTCGTHLALGDYGAKPVVVSKKKKRKKAAAKALNGVGNGVSSGPATPSSMATTPAP